MAINHQDKNVLSIYYQNVRSINNKLRQLEPILASSDYDFIILTETWLTQQNQDVIDTINKLQYESVDFIRNGRGGGVSILIKHGIKYAKCINNTRLELCVIKTSNPQNLIIAGVYIPPNQSETWGDELIEAFNEIQQTYPNSKLIIIGDFNLPSWKPSSTDDNLINDILNELELKQIVDEPSREEAYLDLALVSRSLNPLVKIDTLFTSDHKGFSILVELDYQIRKFKNVKVVNDYNKANWGSFETCLRNLDNTLTNITNPVEFYNIFYDEINRAI